MKRGISTDSTVLSDGSLAPQPNISSMLKNVRVVIIVDDRIMMKERICISFPLIDNGL